MGEPITPYASQPHKKIVGITENNENAKNQEVKTAQVGNINWCRCGECEIMSTYKRSICCQESDIISNVGGNLKCITHPDSFKSLQTVSNVQTDNSYIG